MRNCLLNRVSKHSCVVADASIPRHDGHQLGPLVEQLCGRKMHGIQRANRLHRKRPPNPSENRARDSHDVATAREQVQRSDRRPLVRGRQALGSSGPDDRACGLCERQRGGHTPAGGA